MISLLLTVIFLAFISLGLPDSLLGSAWPTLQIIYNVDSSFVGFVSMTISLMTIISSLLSPKLIKKIKTQYIVIFSIVLTIIGLIGFSFSSQFFILFIFAIPYGLGAGAIDASLNNYVANNYSSRVMNFLHCFYGLGAIISPNIMGLALKYAHWNEGFRWTSYIQIGILLICVLSIPLWNKVNKINNEKSDSKEDVKEVNEETSLTKTLKRRGVILTLIAFFAYCGGEAICFLWTSSYFKGLYPSLSEDKIASFGSLIFFGLMLGRLIAGFISNKINDKNLIRIGIFIELIGIIFISIPLDSYVLALVGFILTGVGMGPIYPSIQHMAPINFTKEYSSSVIALQMSSAYIGSTFMPLLFGIIQENVGIYIMPIFLLIFLIINIVFLELTYIFIKKKNNN